MKYMQQKKKNKYKGFEGTGIFMIVLALGVLLAGCTTSTTGQTASSTQTKDDSMMMDDQSGANSGTMMDDNEMMSDEKSFTLTGENFRFLMNGKESPVIEVNEGDKVTIYLSSTNGLHDWVIDEFNTRTDRVKTGESTSVTFVADKKGTFEYYCSVGSHRANGMVGTLKVV